MAGSKPRASRRGNRRSRLVFYAVPIIAVVFTAGVLGLSYLRPPPIMCSNSSSGTLAMDFTVALSIQVVNLGGNQTRFVVPPSVGIPGGSWANKTLVGYGTNDISPLCMDTPAAGAQYAGFSSIRVRSTAVLNYTLRDFFNVWGEPLGRNNTDLTLSSVVQARQGYVWQMCIGNPTAPNNLRIGNWLFEPLVTGKFITLVYYNQNSQYPGCIG